MSSQIKTVFTAAVLSLALAGCFGQGIKETEGASGGSTDSTIGSEISGTFVDAPVAGLGYSVAAGNSETNSSGQFTCTLGELVTFKVGNLVVGQAACSPVIFPMHLTGESSADSGGGAVAMGVLFRLLDNNSTSGVYTIPPAVRTLNLSGTLNFLTFNSGSDLGSYKSLIDEINSGAGLSIDSSAVQNNYDSVHAPATAAELESNLVNPNYVSVPGNIANFTGKYYLATGTRTSGSHTLCVNNNSINFGLAIGSYGTIGGSGTMGTSGTLGASYYTSVYRATTTDLIQPQVGGGLITSGSTAVRTNQVFISGVTGTQEGNLLLKFGSDGTLKGSLKIKGASFGSESCVYDFVSVQDSAPIAPSMAVLSFGSTANASNANFGTIAVGSSADLTLPLSNNGSVDATELVGSGLAGAYSFKGGAYPGAGGDCGGTLSVGATCNVVVSFAPGNSGLLTDTVEVSYNNGDITLNSVKALRALRGFGSSANSPALLVFEPSAAHSFGSVSVGASVQAQFKVKNTGGTQAISMSGAGLAAPFSFANSGYPGAGGTCGSSLLPGSHCFVNIKYAPTAATASSDAVEINYHNGTGMAVASRNVSGGGSASASASLAFSPSGVVSLGSVAVGGSKDQSFTLSNSGIATAGSISVSGLAAPFSFKGGAYPGTGGNCGISLPSAANCTIVASYSPSSTGFASGTLSVSYTHGSTSSSSSVGLTGSAYAPPALTLSDAPSYSFGSVAVSSTADHSFTLTNSGSGAANGIMGSGFTAPMAFAGGSFPGTGGNCTSSLAAGTSCTMVARFSPTANGNFTRTLTVSYNSGGSFAISRSVSGVGYGAAPPLGTAVLSISDGGTYNYGSLAVGANADKTFVVTNSGSLSASVMAGSGLAAPFSFKGGSYPGAGGSCGTLLAGGANCNMVVTFAPVSAGGFSDVIDLSYNNGGSTAVAQRALTGSGTVAGGGGTVAVLQFSGPSTYSFGTIGVSTTAEMSFTVSHASSGTIATSMAGINPVAPFAFKGGAYPGAGGNCGGTLSVGASCNVVMTFSPGTLGFRMGTAGISYYNGSTTTNILKYLSGSGN